MRRDSLEDRVEKLEKEFRHINEFDGEVSADLDHILFRLARLEDFTGINEAIEFLIQQGDVMTPGITPGSTGTFSATPLGADGNPVALPAGSAAPVWSSSDTTNGPVVAAADGLTATVAVPSTTAGGSFTLTVSSPDLPGQPSGTLSVP